MKKAILLIIGLSILFVAACTQQVSFTIYFNSNGGSDVNSITTDGKSIIVIPDDPEKEGFVFGGWFWDNNTFNQPFTANSLLNAPISSNMTVFAKWVEDDGSPVGTITVTFNSMGGASVSSQHVASGGKLSIPSTTKEGHTLEGWYISFNNGETLDEKWIFASSTINVSLTLYAKWIINTYTITWKNYDGTVLEVDNEAKWGSSPTYNDSTPIKEEAGQNYYVFVGWHEENQSSTLTEDQLPNISKNTTYYARFNTAYKVSFNTSGGTPVEDIIVESNHSIDTTINTTKQSAVFINWLLDGNDFDISTPITSNITLTAKWYQFLNFILKDDGMYSVEFNYQYNYYLLVEEIKIPSFYNDKPVTEIESYAFINAKVETITIPDSITVIGEQAFIQNEYERSLKNIIVDQNNQFFSDYDGVLYSKNQSVLISYPNNKTNTQFTVPNSVVKIVKSAFDGASYLEYIYFEDNSQLEIIEGRAFSSTTSLVSIIIPNSVLEMGRQSYNSFSGIFSHSSITKIEFEEGITNIDFTLIFSDANNLTEIVIPNSVEYLKPGIFGYAPNLVKVTFSEDNAYFTSHNGNVYSKDMTKFIAYLNGSSATSFEIPNTVETIGSYAFNSSNKLTTIIIPNSVTTLEDYVFSQATFLKTITLPSSIIEVGEVTFSGSYLEEIIVDDSNDMFSSLEGVLYNKEQTILLAYPNYKTDTLFIVPDTVQEIKLIDWNYFIRSFVIPISVTKLERYTFVNLHSSFTIYTNHNQKPNGWLSSWNYNHSVYWSGEWYFNDGGVPLPNEE